MSIEKSKFFVKLRADPERFDDVDGQTDQGHQSDSAGNDEAIASAADDAEGY